MLYNREIYETKEEIEKVNPLIVSKEFKLLNSKALT